MKRVLAYLVTAFLALFLLQEVSTYTKSSGQETLFNNNESIAEVSQTGEITDAIDTLVGFVEESCAIKQSPVISNSARSSAPTIIINGKLVPLPSYSNKSLQERFPKAIGKPLSVNSRLYVLRV